MKKKHLFFTLIFILISGITNSQTKYSFTGLGGNDGGFRSIVTNPTGTKILISNTVTYASPIFYQTAVTENAFTYTIKTNTSYASSFTFYDMTWKNFGAIRTLAAGTQIVFKRGALPDVTWTLSSATLDGETSVKTIFGESSAVTGVTEMIVTADLSGFSNTTNNIEFKDITLIVPPLVNTTAVGTITFASAITGGQATSDNGDAITERGVVYSVTATNANPLINGTGVFKEINGTGTGSFSKPILNLISGANYSFRAYSINSGGIGYGEVATFTTHALGNYPNLTIAKAGGNSTVTPNTAPTGNTRITGHTNTNFKGKISVNTVTGVVNITNAHPAGTYVVTVSTEEEVLKTFNLTVGNTDCSNGSFIADAVAGLSIGNDPNVGDFNNDGFQDIASGTATDQFSVNLGNGVGGFGTAINTTTTRTSLSDFSIGDFNGDGNQDIATIHYSSDKASIYLGDGDGSFSNGQQSISVGNGPQSISVGDFNEDGKQDIAVANQNYGNGGSVSILIGDGLGAFTVSTPVIVGLNSKDVVIGDFNGDTHQDLATTNPNDNTVSINLGNGDGTFGLKTAITVGTIPTGIAIGDINNDNIQDFVTSNSTSNNISVVLGIGNGTFAAPTTVSVATDPRDIILGDFNGDGNEDIASVNRIANNVSIRLGDGFGGFTGSTELAVGTDPQTITVGDFNKDGLQDIATPGFIHFGVRSEINLQGNSVNITAGSNAVSTTNATNFGNITMNTTMVKTYTIQNSGTESLIISSIVSSGTNATDFTVGGITVPATITAGTSSTFTLTLTTALQGEKTATITVNNDNCDKGSYAFAVKGKIVTTPTVATTAAGSIASTSATLGGNVTTDGELTVTERGIVYSSSDTTPTIAEGAIKNTNGTGEGVFTKSITGLTEGTQYYFNTYAINALGTSYGTSTTFTTTTTTPTVTTTAASSIGSISVTLAGNVITNGGVTVTNRGIVYSTSDTTPTLAEGANRITKGTGIGVFTASFSSLTEGTQYYFNTYATNALGTSYGTSAAFKTTITTPTVTTDSPKSLARTSVTLEGNVDRDGGSAVTERGIVYATSDTSPTIAEGATKYSSGAGKGHFTESISGLAEVTQYYFNTYAINALGTSYGTAKTFTTATTPTVTTTTASSIGSISATLAGNVTTDGELAVTERGIVYSTSDTTPTIAEGATKNTNGTGTGVFTESISGLTESTQYYFNTYALNSLGTSYGVASTFTTLSIPTVAFTDFNKTYGDADFDLTATSNSSGSISYSIVSGGTGTASLAGTNNRTVSLGNVGTVKIRATQTANGEYYSATKDITLTIAQKEITITADNIVKQQGGVEPTLTYKITVGSIVNSDTFSGSLVRVVGEALADYPILQGTLTINDNYDITYIAGIFSINSTLSMNAIENSNQIQLFPNPSSGIIYLKAGSSFVIETIDLYRSNGKLIKSYGFEKKLDISNLSSGVYFARIKTNKGMSIKRIIKE